MIEQQEYRAIDIKELVGVAASLYSQGHRLVQICCTRLDDGFEFNYSFDRGGRFLNARFICPDGSSVPSISLVYPNAFLYENEIHDLFGVTITDMAVDYGGTLYRTSVPAPFAHKPKKQGDGETADKE